MFSSTAVAIPPIATRDSQRKEPSLTVCIAGINYSGKTPCIITASDRNVSFFGGYFAAEGVAMKITKVNDDWGLMFAGTNSPLVPVIETIKKRCDKMKPTGLKAFARTCSKIYREERKEIVENEILVDYDVDSYAEYLALKSSNHDFYSLITEEIKKKEETWNLLFAGFDHKKNPHIFVIAEKGKIQYCDVEGFAAIGSGALRALVSLSSHPFKRNLQLDEAIFAMISAKFSAESADGVGEETIVAILEPKQNIVPVMSEFFLSVARKEWDSLPRYREEAMLEQTKEDLERIFRLIMTVEKIGDSTLLRLIGKEIKSVRELTKTAGGENG